MSTAGRCWWGELSSQTLPCPGSFQFTSPRLNLSRMKFATFLLFLSTLALGQTSPPAPSSSIPVDQENANKARGLINQAIQALGGDAYLNIRDISESGRTYSLHNGEAEGAGILFWSFYKYPDKARIELTKQRDIIYIYRGDEGFEKTYKGIRAEDPTLLKEYLRRRNYALDYVLREWIKQPGVALFYDGATVAAQKDAQQVTILNAHDQGVTLYFDSNTHLPVKKSFIWRDPTDKERNTEEEIYDNYRPVQGIMTPFSTSRYYNGAMANERFLHSVTYNQGLSDSLFEASVTNEPSKGQRK